MKTRVILPALAVAALALAGCANSNDTSSGSSSTAKSSSSSSTSVSSESTPTTYTGVTTWYGRDQGAEITVTTNAQAPANVVDSWVKLGTQHEVATVEVDNTKGTAPVTEESFGIGSPSGEYAQYDRLDKTLETSGAALDDSATNNIIDIHNEYAEDAYTVPVGAKKTLYLAGDTPAPSEAIAPTLGGGSYGMGTPLVPLDKKDEYDGGSSSGTA